MQQFSWFAVPVERYANFATLPDSGFALDRCDQFRGVIADAPLEHRFHLANVADAGGRIAVDDDEIRLFADGEAADRLVAAEILRAVERRDRDRFERREARIDEQLDLPLIREARDHAAAAGRVGAGDQQA